MAYSSYEAHLGSTANPFKLSKANKNYTTQYFKTVNTSGDVRALYQRVYFTRGGAGEVHRLYATQNYATVTGGTINALHASLGFGTGGALLGGLGHAARFSVDTPDAAMTGNCGVIGLDLNAGGTSTSVGQEVAFIRATMGGNATGLAALEDGASLLSLNGFTAATGNVVSKSFLRIDKDGTNAYIPYSDTAESLTLYPISSGSDSAAGLYVRSLNDTTAFFTNATTARSYLVYINGNRPAAYPLGVGGGGVDDASLRIIYRSYAADGANCQQRGLNVQARHSGTTGGSIGNLISTNASTSTTLSADCVALTLVNEDYAPGTGGVSGALDVLHLHEGPNATGGEFGIRIRNQKKNGSANGAFLTCKDDATASTYFTYGIDLNDCAPTTADIRLANGMVIASSAAAVNDNDSTTLPKGSLVTTSNATGGGTLFISDGSNLQAIALA